MMPEDDGMSAEETNEEDDERYKEDELPPLIPLNDDVEDDEEMIADYLVIPFRRSTHNNIAPNKYNEFSEIRGYSRNR